MLMVNGTYSGRLKAMKLIALLLLPNAHSHAVHQKHAKYSRTYSENFITFLRKL